MACENQETHFMPLQTSSSERLHALDNLRAVMMWLGIVLHVAVIYMVRESPLPWRDGHASLVADFLVALIHSFRMPVFFILAGFFVALLAQRRGWAGMLKNRLMRLGLPFVLLWPVIFSATIVMALLFMHRMAHGTWGMDEALLVPREGSPRFSTLHMWFLWMLMWLSVLTVSLAPLARLVPPAVRERLSAGFERLAGSAWGFAVLALPLAVAGSAYKNGVVTASGAFLPPMAEWLHNGLFFAFGLALYAHRHRLLALYQQRWASYAATGLGLFTAALVLGDPERHYMDTLANYPFWFALVYNGCTWLWSFALIGLSLRHVGRQNRFLDYLSQSSYWVYLIHLPLTVGIGAYLYEFDLPALAKMLINMTLTTVVALVSYHLLVRSTHLGGLLNGRRHPFTFFGWRFSHPGASLTPRTWK